MKEYAMSNKEKIKQRKIRGNQNFSRIRRR